MRTLPRMPQPLVCLIELGASHGAQGDFDYIDPSYLDKYPALKEHKVALEAHELWTSYIAEYEN